jgi:hypothetical protein
MVFIWMGEQKPAPIEEDVPPELFDNYTRILYSTEIWPANWNVALENGGDAHVPYVHRNAVRTLMFGNSPISGYRGSRQRMVNGRAIVPEGYRGRGSSGTAGRGMGRGNRVQQVVYPGINAKWPKHTWRNLWSWMFRLASWRHARKPDWDVVDEWSGGHHLPGMYRGDHKTDMYTRNAVPIDEKSSRQIYYKAIRPKSVMGWWYEKIHFHLYGRWMQVSNFSVQDFRVVGPQRYDTQEYLSATDAHQVVWRRLVLQARGMMAPTQAQKISDTKAEAFSFARQQEVGKRPDRFATLAAEEEKGSNGTKAAIATGGSDGSAGPSGM